VQITDLTSSFRGILKTKLTGQRNDWEELAALDPLWAVLSDAEMRFNRWDHARFFRTGAQEIGALVAHAKQLGFPEQWHRALDFGCGVGRLTRALRAYFPECHGVDISSRMLRTARELTPECDFHINVETNLHLFDDSYFDLVYSVIVLQHQPSRAVVLSYVNEFLRVLRRGGLLVFQLPCYVPVRNRLQVRRRLYALLHSIGWDSHFLYRRLNLAPIRMLCISENDIVSVIHSAGGKTLDVRPDDRAGKTIQSRTYYVSR
jgi:SAM-dependent methyltransferase